MVEREGRRRPSGTVTFLFTDIEGSSDLAQRHPDAFPGLLARHHAILQQAVEEHDGFVFQIVGDAFCVAFHTALDAVGAAIAAQRLLHGERWTPAPIKVRMGVNTGAAEISETPEARSGGYIGYSTLARVQRVMSAAYGGQVVLSSASAEQARVGLPDGVSLRDLGEHHLKGLRHPEHLWQLVVPDLPDDFPRLQTMSSAPSNLPLSLNAFVGRARERQEVKERLRQSRLLTLLGTGGTGKTRLAIEVARDVRQDFDDRVYFVDMASTRDVESVLAVIAGALGLREQSARPLLEDLKDEIRTRKTLLVLDNFEQVTAAGPTMVELLRDCPELRALVTSREVLHVTGENVFPVPPLALPRTEFGHVTIATLDELARSEAVQLFVERARAIQPGFQLTQDNARAVAELCVRLDGLPLAIELVCARLGLFSPQALVKRLGDRLKLLRGGARDVPSRQQTLSNTIGWSYEMLDGVERRLFELLSVFSGATLTAVEEVASQVKGLDEIDVLDALSSLVDKSLARLSEQADGQPCLVMLETIRDFATARLEEDSELCAAARRAHATYFADWTQRQWEPLNGDGREAASEQLLADMENVRAAWRYWVGHGDLDQLDKLTDTLWLLYDGHGWYEAMAALTSDLLDLLAGAPSSPERVLEQITLQTSLARALLALRGYTEEVERAYTEALELCESAGEVPELLPVLRGLSSFYIYRAEFDKGARTGEQILGLAERYDDQTMRVEGHLVLGACLAMLNRLELGMQHLEQGIAAYDPDRHDAGRFRLGNNPGVVCFITSALVLWMLGFPDRARDRAHGAVELAKRLNHPSTMAYALFHTGLIHLWRREDDLANGCAEAVLDIAEEHEFDVWRAVGGCLQGAACAGLGSPDEGLARMERAMSTYQRLNTPPVFWPLLLYLQAGVCGAAARPAEGLALLDEALRIATQTPANTLWSEFFQLKGDLLLALSPDDTTNAEVWFQKAVDTATEVQAPMLQLRAALRLGRLWRGQGRADDARNLLGSAYELFSEGSSIPDLRDARALLDQLT